MDDEELLEKAKERWELCDTHYAGQYQQAEKDWQFTHGEGQWDVGAQDVRNKDGRPSLVLNQLLPYVNQAANDIKKARLAIRVVPIDSQADVDTAEIRGGIIRNIEKQSKAKDVYGTAAKNAIGAGIGWIRVTVDYADNDTFDQEALIERVLDFTSVYLDPQDTSVDGSDSDYGFIRLTYTLERFEELYPDAAPISFFGLTEGGDDEVVNIVEYYYKEIKKTKLHEVKVEGELAQLTTKDLKLLKENDIAYEEVRSREIEEVTIKHSVLSGDDVLSHETFPCHYIPLVPVIGEEYFVNGKREFRSLIDQAKDAQRMYNYWKSASTEFIALQPKSPWVGPVGSFQSHPEKWRTANTQNYAYLEYDVVTDEDTGQPLPPPMRAPPIQGSPAMMQEAMGAREDIRLGLGMPQSNMGERSNAVSGVAIRAQQIEGDNATFHFIDNLSSSIAQVGRILNDIIPALYSDRKIARIIGEDGTEENIPVNVPYVTEEGETRESRGDESPHGVYDLSVGKYDIEMDVGPSYASGRQETADKLIEISGKYPEIIPLAGDILFDVLDIPRGEEIADRIRAGMDPSLLGDDPQAARLQQASQELQKMQETIANYEAALEEKNENTEFDKKLKAEEMQLDRDKFDVDSQKTKADIDKIYADIKGEDEQARALASANIDAVMSHVGDLQQTMELILNDIEEDVEANQVTSEPAESVEMLTESET